MRAAAPLLLSALLLPALAGCANPPGSSASSKSPDVMATFYPVQFLTQRVAGPDLTVGSVVKPGTEPHDYEATAADIVNINDAKALVIMGAGFESWLKTAQSQAPNTKLIVSTEGIKTHANPNEAEARNLPADPHTWMSPVLAQQMVRNIQNGLAGVWPDKAATFKANADQLVADLQELDREYRLTLAHCAVPFAVTNHAAFGYMAEAYNFTQVPVSGLDPEAEPDAQTVAHVVDEAKAHNVTVIFFEDNVSPKVAQTIADQVGASTRVLSPIEIVPEGRQKQGADYFTVMREDMNALHDGMKCSP
ncbi:MAG: zinc transport system substrate-binding protein [Thermoplasmata archaeon]|jgi:zinc transport system substrate-binding protein|nr:zinc transport system substrate-binding protein [Thermoplasmata archaeon]